MILIIASLSAMYVILHGRGMLFVTIIGSYLWLSLGQLLKLKGNWFLGTSIFWPCSAVNELQTEIKKQSA